jgi:hypothetical protein
MGFRAKVETLDDFIKQELGIAMEYNTEGRGMKYDDNKPRFDLLPFDLMGDEQKVWEYGAKKYAPNNWRKGMPMTQALNAAMRHLSAYMMGEDNDPESNISHLAHVITSIRIAQNTYRYYPDLDDRHRWEFTKE